MRGGLAALLLALGPSCAPLALQTAWNDVHFETETPVTVETRVGTDAEETEGLTLVAATLEDGLDAWFVFDTGATVTVLDDDVARRAGLVGGPSVSVGCGLAGRVERGSRFQLGSYVAHDPAFVVLDLDALFQDVVADIPIAGAIGPAVLERAVVRVQYATDGDRVTVQDPSSYVPPEGHWHEASYDDGAPLVAGAVAGGGPGRFHLDTGKSGTLSVSVPYTERHDLLEGRDDLVRAENRRLCGVEEELAGTVDWVELAGHRLDGLTAQFRVRGTDGGDTERAADAVVGRQILRRFDLTFDTPRGRVRVVPRPDRP